MAASGDEETLDIEIQLLNEIYINELTVTKDSNGFPGMLELLLHPATGEDAESQFVCLTLQMYLPKEYPNKAPDIHIKNPRGLADEHIKELRQNLQKEADDKIGDSMLYELIELTKESLTKSNIPHGKCAVCLEQFHESDDFRKTECYHYFHSMCLYRYIEHDLERIKEEKEEQKNIRHIEVTEKQIKKPRVSKYNTFSSDRFSSEDKNQELHPPVTSDKVATLVVCPVCRKPISYELKDLSKEKKIADEKIIYIPDEYMRELQKQMAKQYSRQKEKGGIIDLEAERNKYFLPQTASTNSLDSSNVEYTAKDNNQEYGRIKQRLPINAKDNTRGRGRPFKSRDRYDKSKKSAFRSDNRRSSWSADYKRNDRAMYKRQDDFMDRPERKEMSRGQPPRQLSEKSLPDKYVDMPSSTMMAKSQSFNENCLKHQNEKLGGGFIYGKEEGMSVEIDCGRSKHITTTAATKNSDSNETNKDKKGRVGKTLDITEDMSRAGCRDVETNKETLNTSIDEMSNHLVTFTLGDDSITHGLTKQKCKNSKAVKVPGGENDNQCSAQTHNNDSLSVNNGEATNKVSPRDSLYKKPHGQNRNGEDRSPFEDAHKWYRSQKEDRSVYNDNGHKHRGNRGAVSKNKDYHSWGRESNRGYSKRPMRQGQRELTLNDESQVKSNNRSKETNVIYFGNDDNRVYRCVEKSENKQHDGIYNSKENDISHGKYNSHNTSGQYKTKITTPKGCKDTSGNTEEDQLVLKESNLGKDKSGDFDSRSVASKGNEWELLDCPQYNERDNQGAHNEGRCMDSLISNHRSGIGGDDSNSAVGSSSCYTAAGKDVTYHKTKYNHHKIRSQNEGNQYKRNSKHDKHDGKRGMKKYTVVNELTRVKVSDSKCEKKQWEDEKDCTNVRNKDGLLKQRDKRSSRLHVDNPSCLIEVKTSKSTTETPILSNDELNKKPICKPPPGFKTNAQPCPPGFKTLNENVLVQYSDKKNCRSNPPPGFS